MVLLRFAPSPTGPLHLGGLRMALYNHLFARKNGGKWILRIEDTDMSRHVPGSVEGITQALDWAGLHFDHGPGREGPHGPYFQSKRLDLYKQYAGRLLESGHAYRCFCSPDVLTETREKLARSGSSASYDRRCLHLTEEEAARKVRAGEKHTVRFNNTAPLSRPPAVDMIFGNPRDAHASLATDPILLKSDQFPTYHLASVVDDHEMGITHVLRGEEWLPSLPLHLDIYASLTLPVPSYGHMPILLNADGSKMSKRHGDVQVVDFIKRGWEPAAVLNWLVLSGWGSHQQAPGQDAGVKKTTPQYVPDSTHIMTLDEMIDQFDIAAITHRATTLEASKLAYINKHHLMPQIRSSRGLHALAERVHTQIKEAFPTSQYTTLENIKHAIRALEGRLTNLYDIPVHAPYLFIEPDLTSESAKATFTQFDPELYRRTVEGVRERLGSHTDPWDQAEILKILHEKNKDLGIPPKQFMKVVRYALTGMKDGPAIADIVEILGRERTLARLK